MKRNILIAVAFMATMTAWSQNIAVVSPSNATKTYLTLDTAIKGAEDGSIIYLPGGGWVINDTTVINKRLTIMGVSHRGDTDNTDGATIIGGNLNFVAKSSGSAVMGCYLSGDVNIGTADDAVNNILIRYCNLNSVQVKNSGCQGITINQNYIRAVSGFGNSNPHITNNVLNQIRYVNGGIIKNNIITSEIYAQYKYHIVVDINNSIISGNIYINNGYGENFWACGSSNDEIYDNMQISGYFDETNKHLDGAVSWDDVFKKYNNGAISTTSDFHFSEDYKQYENKYGIYAGTSFNDKQLAPIPRIVSKTVDEQTDGSGRLLINITVKAQ